MHEALNHLSDRNRSRLKRILLDPLASPSSEEKSLIWDARYRLVGTNNMLLLPKLLLSVDWCEQ